MSRLWTGCAVAAATILAGGCYETISSGVDGGAVIADPDGRVAPLDDAGPPPPTSPDVDLLFMVDDSISMTEEQGSLHREIPAMIERLATEVRSLQLGVITSDMGSGGFTVPTCEGMEFGDDGILRTAGRPETPGCDAAYPPFLAWEPGLSPESELAADATCLATVGTGGCGFEQPLEAALKALSPARPTAWTRPGYAPPTFSRGTPGHGDRANDGLVRPGSVLAIVLLTDEEDCSAHDPGLYDPESTTYGGTDLNLRCWAHAAEALHPVERYVDGLLQLRHRPSRLVFVPIAGVPPDLVPAAGEPVRWDSLIGPPGLRDPRLEERVDPRSPNRLSPSCDTPGRGIALPPIRILEVTRALEARGATVGVGSVCQDSHAAVVTDAILRALR